MRDDDDVLIAVVGAGAAGIAAARRIHDAGRRVILLEAKERVGGRARTLLHNGMAMDLGCGWLHSARRNPWTGIAATGGYTIRKDTARWGEQWRDLGFPKAEQDASDEAWARWEAAARAAADGPDRPLSDFIAADDPWRPMINAISGFANGAALADVSLHDWLAYEDASTEDNWAVREGYGTVVADHARGLEVRRCTPVTRIEHGGARLRLTTSDGTLEADAVIVAAPTTVLAAEQLRFDPPLPDKHAAAANLPLGVADKAFLEVSGTVPWPHDAHLFGNPHDDCTASYRLSPFGFPLVEVFLGGPAAEKLEERDVHAFAVDELVRLLGADWRPRLSPVTASRWRHESWISGSYSHARIGHAPDRAVLAAPVEQRIFFAGEACHPHDFSTAHGAYETGIVAADAALARFSATE